MDRLNTYIMIPVSGGTIHIVSSCPLAGLSYRRQRERAYFENNRAMFDMATEALLKS